MSGSSAIRARVDVTDQVCPLSFVKAKLALEEIPVGERLQVRLLGGEAKHNVPRSFEMEGHRLHGLTPEDDSGATWQLVVERVK